MMEGLLAFFILMTAFFWLLHLLIRFRLFSRLSDVPPASRLLAETSVFDAYDFLSIKIHRIRGGMPAEHRRLIRCFAYSEWLAWLGGLLMLATSVSSR